MTQNEIATVLADNGFGAFADRIRSASGAAQLECGTIETDLASRIREATMQLERDYLPGMMSDEAGGRYLAALAALREGSPS